ATLSNAGLTDGNGQGVSGQWTINSPRILFTPDQPLGTGDYTLTIYPADTPLGNTRTSILTFSIDLSPPGPPSLNPLTTPVSDQSQTISGTKEAGTAIWLDSTEIIPHDDLTEWSHVLPLAEGINTHTLHARDLAGNASSTVDISIISDRTPPVLSGTSPSDNSFIKTSPPVISLLFNDALTSLDPSPTLATGNVENSSGQNIAGSWTIENGNTAIFTPSSVLAQDRYVISLTAHDRAGNSKAAAFSFTYDNTPPAAPVLFPVQSPTNFSVQTLSGNKEANTAVWLNGKEVVPLDTGTSWSYQITLTQGANSLVLFARDAAGNQSTEVTDTIIYDETAPLPVTNLTADGNHTGSMVSLDWTGYQEAVQGDVASYRVYASPSLFTQVSGLTPAGTVQAGTFTYTVQGLSKNTLYYFAVVAVDTKGNANNSVTPVSAVPSDIIPPDEVANLKCTSFKDQLVFTWDPPPENNEDLAGFKISVGAEDKTLLPGQTSYELTALPPATGYLLKISTLDQDDNQSPGLSLTGVTWLANPEGLTGIPYSGYAALSWSPPAQSQYVRHYAVYASETEFTSVEGMPPVLTTPLASASVAGLTDSRGYYFAVTSVNTSGGEDKSVSTIFVTPEADTEGPEITNVKLDGTALVQGATVSTPAFFTCDANDPAGINRVEFAIDGTAISRDYSPVFSADWNILLAADGSHTLTITAYDTLANSSSVEFPLTVALAVPQAPEITSPENNASTNKAEVSVTGLAAADTRIMIYNNGAQAGDWVDTDKDGSFTTTVTLTDGENRLKATAANRAGSSPFSPEILITLDTALPDPPHNLTAQARPSGQIRLLWQAPLSTADIEGYHVYRSPASFAVPGQAEKLTAEPVASKSYTDLPSNEDLWYYRVSTVDRAGNESALSGEAEIRSDRTLPRALSVEYDPQGNFDPISGRMAPGRVNVLVSVSEALSALPFFTITPLGGNPVSVELTKETDLTYTGRFDISGTTPSGTAYAVFSAMDLAGNRGTEIDTGTSVLLDTNGPAITRLSVVPAAPVQNDPQDPSLVTVTFGLNETVKPGSLPALSYLLSGPDREPASISQITQLPAQDNDIQTWQAVFTLPEDAGQAAPETLSFTFTATDDLDNPDGGITVANQFQVYQGDLPPLPVPGGLTGKALPGGQVYLAWEKVENATGYNIYRQTPDTGTLEFLTRIDNGLTYTDTTPSDGAYLYAVASLRRDNGQEAVSGQSPAVTVNTDATAPEAPSGLTLELVSRGIRCTWQAPAYTESVTYNLYRDDAPEILTVQGLTPLATGLTVTDLVDPTPSPTAHCYVVTAVDKTGNESVPSNSFYLNFDLLPIAGLTVVQEDNEKPVVSWSHPSAGLLRYEISISAGGKEILATSVLPDTPAFTDQGYTGGERTYTVTAVDQNGAQSMGRSITLPALESALESPVIKRGIMNQVNVKVTSLSGKDLSSLTAGITVNGRAHTSVPLTLKADSQETIPVIVGGYKDLTGFQPATVDLVTIPNPGEEVRITRSHTLETLDAMLKLTMFNDPFIRGGLGRVWFELENTGAAEIEIITAQNSGASPGQADFYLVDTTDNVLSTASLKQALGDKVLTLSNKKTVARIPAGERFTSNPVDIFVPANAPDQVIVRLDLSDIYYHLGRPDEITMEGLTTRQEISLTDTSYYGKILSAFPEVSKGDQDITITGQALDRATDAPLADVPLNLIITVNGFERKIPVETIADGTFTHIFEPLENEAGIFRVNAVHPDLLDRPDQGSFIINRVQVSPSKISLSIPKNYEQKISLKVITEQGTDLTNLSLSPEATLPQGVHLSAADPIPLVTGGSTISLNFALWADNTADEASEIRLKVTSDESGDTPWGLILINTLFSESKPALYFTPDHIETGVAQDDIITESITLTNRGLAAMTGVTLSLIDATGSPAPDWIRLNTPSDIGTLAVGEEREVSISFLPGTDEPQGMKVFYLRVTSSNYAVTDIGLYPTVTSSGIGNALFKLSDIYTGTFNAKNELIRGLSGAKIRLQNEETLSDVTATTDELGEALFEDLPSGPYKCRITADSHQEYTGRVWIKPGITVSKEVFLEYNLVTVEWEVNEITIEDKYEILLTATFETDVPAAVVVAKPQSLTLPDMEKGDVFLGEFTLINHGLVRADNLSIPVPESDANFQYEILTGLPDTLEAKQRITVPYRITCLKSLDRDEEEDTGGGCYTYQKCIPITYGYTCANGDTTSGATRHCFYKRGGTCGSTGGSSGSGSAIFYSGGSGGTSSPAPASTPMISTEQKCMPKPDPRECKSGTCKASGQNQSTAVGSEINTLMREYRDNATDLSVKVPNGMLTITRRYRSGRWQWDELNRIADGRLDDKTVYTPSAYGPEYITRGDVPYKRTARGVYTSDTFTVERKTDTNEYTEDKYTFRDKSGNWITYDSMGRPMSWGDRNNTTATFIYDGQDDAPPSGLADHAGTQVLWFEYDADNNLTRVYDTGAREVRYEYTSNRLTRVVDVLGHDILYEYDGGNLVKKTNALGHEVTVTYDKSNNPIKVTDQNGAVHTFEYDYDKNKKEYYALVRDPAGMIKEIWYSDDGETKQVDINGDTVQKISKDGRNYYITDRNGHRTYKEYDENDNLKKITYADGSTVLYQYDLKLNKVIAKQDQLNRITTFEYDEQGNLTQKTEGKGSSAERATTYDYDSQGRLLTSTTRADADTPEAVTTFTYDDQGNLASVTDPMDNTTLFTSYDIMGNLLTKTDARGKEWIYAYDPKGRLTSQTDPLGNTTTFEYDALDNRTAATDPNLKRTEYHYDGQSNLVKAIDPLGNETLMEYAPDKKLTSQADPAGNTTQYEYDAERRMVKTIDAAGNATQMVYTGDGCSSCSGTGEKPERIIYPTFEKRFTYDDLGRKLTETDTLSDTESRTTGFEYDAAGNLIKKTDARGNETHYAYDNLNRLKLVMDPDDNITRYAYDARDNLISLTDAENNTTLFEYDAGNRLTRETRPMGQATAYAYDANGNLAQKVDAKNQKTLYIYDDANRLTSILYFADAADTTPSKTVVFTYDNAGNLKTWNDGSASGLFTYDEMNRKLTDSVNFGPFEKNIAYTWTPNSQKSSYTDPSGAVYNYSYVNNLLAGIEIPGTGTITTGAY
ncbi:MAG: fibronectin type III domain-containing protein, partial [Desulfobacterales bacterium]|nr:fibronectin type III domain-containing protein [Desulfobacterales bacterium]